MTAVELVDLVPPYTRSMSDHRPEYRAEPVRQGPRFVRTRSMGRWHRVRSGTRYGSRVCWQLWCGYTVTNAALALASDTPTDLPACGTCEGRALGAGQEDNEGPRDLIFVPAGTVPPKWCPGSRSETLFDPIPDPRGWPRRGICLVCGSEQRISVAGGPYRSYVGLANHLSTPEMNPGCPLHRYQYLGKTGDGVLECWTCSRRLSPAPRTLG